MTQIDLTLRGIPAERVAAVLAAIGGTITIDASLVPTDNAVTQIYREQLGAAGAQPDVTHFGNQQLQTYTATPYQPGDVPPGSFGTPGTTDSPVPGVTHNVPIYQPPATHPHVVAQSGSFSNPETYQPYDAGIAAAIFSPNAPAPVAAYVPPATGATAQPLASAPPVHSAATLTPGSASNWPSTVDISLGLDKAGRPWDSRINSKGNDKKLAKTQEWKLARNIDKALVAQVHAELAAITGSQAPQGVTRINDVVQPAAHQGARTDVQVMQQGMAAMAGHQVTTYTPPAPIVTGLQYGDIVLKVTGAIASRAVESPVMTGMFAHYKIADIADLANHPGLWQTIANEIDRLSVAPQ